MTQVAAALDHAFVFGLKLLASEVALLNLTWLYLALLTQLYLALLGFTWLYSASLTCGATQVVDVCCDGNFYASILLCRHRLNLYAGTH